MKYILPLVLALILLPDLVQAQTLGLTESLCEGPTCSACHFVELANRLIKWLIGIVVMLFAVLAVWAGFSLVTSGGNPSALQDAKSRFTNAFIGFLIVLSAWLIVDTLMRGIVNGTDGDITGYGPWSQIQCGTQSEVGVTPDTLNITIEAAEDAGLILPDAGGNCPAGYTFDAFGSCVFQPTTVSPDAGGNCPAGYIFDPFGDCEFNPSSLPADLAVNQSMNPIFNPAQGGSSLVQPGAQEAMQALLAGPFRCLQQGFGRSITINDGIAKAGTSRETQTPNSRHFHGDALDLSTRGMSDTDQIRLFNQARQCGFRGFGFGATILHVDLGSRRGWSYNNSTYGGQSVGSLINSI